MLVLAMEFSRSVRTHPRSPTRAEARREPRVAVGPRRPDGPADTAGEQTGDPAGLRSCPQNGTVMPAVHRSARLPHERDTRRCAVRAGRDAKDGE